MSDFGENASDEPTDQETVAGRLARAGGAPKPGHPAEGASTVTAGEAESRDEEPTSPTGDA